MSDIEDYERGYAGHGRGIVMTQPAPGEFVERPMTAGELAARAPAWAIGADPYEFLTRAAFVYIRAWEVIAPAIDAALAAQAAQHDRRIAELLEANNREVERRRGAEEDSTRFEAMLRHCVRLLAIIAAPRPEGDDTETPLEKDQREAAWSCLETVAAFCPDVVADSRGAGHA